MIKKIWDYLIENGVATEEELKLITCINGYSVESLNSVIYARTGFHDIEQLKGDEEEETEEQ